jgi:hypothetical protein
VEPRKNIDAIEAKLAFTIIDSLLKSNEALSDLLAVMAHAIDEDTAKALTNTAEWERYMETRRGMDTTKTQVEEFEKIISTLEESS